MIKKCLHCGSIINNTTVVNQPHLSRDKIITLIDENIFFAKAKIAWKGSSKKTRDISQRAVDELNYIKSEINSGRLNED